MITTILFDMDGVLIDSQDLHFRAYQSAFHEQGLSIKEEWYAKVSPGATRNTVLARYIEDFAPEHIDERKLSIQKAHHMQKLMELNPPSIAEDAEQVLATLLSRFKLAVVTSSKMGKELLRSVGLLDFFAAVVIPMEGLEPKPAPDMFLHAAFRLDSEPMECVVVEDSLVGVLGARAAQMKSIAFSIGGFRDSPPPADALCSRLDEIPRIVGEWSE